MRKLFTLLLLLCVTTVFGQQSQDTLRLKHFSTWAIAPYISAPFQYMDIKPISLSTKLTGLGVNLEKHLSHYTSFQVGYFNTPLYSSNEGLGYRININQWDARFYVHITNGNTLRTWRSTQLYLYGGFGKLKHSSQIYNDSTNEQIKSVDGKAMVAILGGGAKYRVGDRTSIFLDGSGNFTSSDRIDATKVAYSFNDGYFKLSLGMTYTFGKKKMIEWDNPYQYLVPEEVHDTTVVLKTIIHKYEAPKVDTIWPDTATIYYLPKSYSIELPYIASLDSVIDKAVSEGDVSIKRIEISAYCDTMGSDNTNKLLVLKRGNAVARYVNAQILKKTGVDVSQFTSIILNDESAAIYAPDARNRKVVVRIVRPIE